MNTLARAAELSSELRDWQQTGATLAAERDALVTALLADGLTVRDVATLLDLSPARVGQISARDRLRTWGPRGKVTVQARDIEIEREAHYVRCEEATRGCLLNKRGKAARIDPRDMLRRGGRMLTAYQSEELWKYLKTDPIPRHADQQKEEAS